MRLVVQLDGADDREIAGATHDEIEVLGCDSIQCPLASRSTQARLDRGDVGDADLAEDAMICADRLIEGAEERRSAAEKSVFAR